MKKDLNKQLEELNEIKKKYKKILKIFMTTLIIILFVIIFKILYNFTIYEKIIEANMVSNFGSNYKITRTSSENRISYTYRKDDIFQNIHPNETAIVFVKDVVYVFNIEKKEYQEIEWNMANPLEVEENNMSKSDRFVNYVFSGVKISKEENNGIKYITMRVDTNKFWINPETYYIEKELQNGNFEESKIEKNVVKDSDILYYKLDEFKKIEPQNNK